MYAPVSNRFIRQAIDGYSLGHLIIMGETENIPGSRRPRSRGGPDIMAHFSKESQGLVRSGCP